MISRARAPLDRARSWCRAAACVTCIALAPISITEAQLIGIKTVPIAEGDQFRFLPSANLGMAGVSIALPDTLLDPFSNPAKATRIRRPHVFGSPTSYSVSNNSGSGRTLPLGTLARFGSSFGGLGVAIQEISPARTIGFSSQFDRVASTVGSPLPQLSPLPRTNRYAFALLGRSFAESKLSVGASVFWSGLRAMEGVEQLYAGSQGIEQFGDAVDLRAGLLREWKDDRSFEAVVVHNRFGVTHDVNYLESFWDPDTRSRLLRSRIEHNVDRTRIAGLHLAYVHPVDSGLRLGWVLTANRMSHPKIPNYEIMSIPRDPGYSSAFNVGMGLAEREGPTTLGIDVIYEPIWSHTWAEAAEIIQTSGGGMILPGGKTIENRFRFANGLVRAGLSREFDLGPTEMSLRLHLGTQVRSIRYRLNQYDNVQRAGRLQRESWNEWTRTLGASLRMSGLDFHYQWLSRTGTGRPGVATAARGDFALAAAQTIIVAPSGPLSLQPVRVTAHHFSISVPLQ